MKKQRWRKTKVKTCYLCDKKLNINQIRGINDWSYKNKILYWCEGLRRVLKQNSYFVERKNEYGIRLYFRECPICDELIFEDEIDFD
ncbi:hypothetical protein ACT7DH_27800 [Bacillus pacificus]